MLFTISNKGGSTEKRIEQCPFKKYCLQFLTQGGSTEGYTVHAQTYIYIYQINYLEYLVCAPTTMQTAPMLHHLSIKVTTGIYKCGTCDIKDCF